jgi:parallel beta-helix repeat protein
MQGHHWIVENNVVRQVNGLGLDYGRRHTFLPWEVPADTPKLGGVGHIIRRNRFLDCGVCSLSGLGLIGGLVEDNYSSGCGWHRVAPLCESGGIKLHYMKHSLVRRNVVNGTIQVFGLWVDHSNHNTRVTQNVVVGAQASAMYLEASYGPNLIDQNILWDSKGPGILLYDSENATVANNLIGCCTGPPVLIGRCTPKGRMVDMETKRFSCATHNRVVGNVFYGFGPQGPQIPNDSYNAANVSDFNVFVDPPEVKPLDLAAWQQKTGFETHSRVVADTLEFSNKDGKLRGLLPTLEFPRIHAVTCDYFGAARAGETTDAGPFLKLNLKPEMVLVKNGPGDGTRP